jgi:hypothetical protein
MITEKRRHPRIATKNILLYSLYDSKKNKVGHGKGRTINISQSGTLIQTEKMLKGDFVVLMTLDLDGNKIKVNGEIITSRICETTGSYLTGIEFIGPKDQQIAAIVAFVKIYQRQKHLAYASGRI